MPRGPSTQRRADMSRAIDPHDPDGPRAHSASGTTTRAGQVSRLTGSRRPGPGVQASRSPRPPQALSVTGPTMSMSHTRTARPARAPTPILAAPGVGGGRAGWGPGQRPQSGLRRGLGLGSSAAPAPQSARLCCRQPYRTGSAAAAASAASYARARGGAGAGQSGVLAP